MRLAPLPAVLVTLLTSTALHAAPAPSPIGTWRNAANSVRIRVAPCGRGLCGTVVAASDKARADAAAGGTPQLVGTQLFRDFRAIEGGDGWEGTVFVPDLGIEVQGTLALDGADTLVAEGCLFGGIGCREQRWVRVGRR